MQLKPAVRKQSMWFRDEFRLLQDSLLKVESAEESEEKLAWVEEFWDVCRSAENAIGLFTDKQHLKKGSQHFKSLLWTPHKFMSQRKFIQQLDRLKSKVADLSANVLGVVSKVIKIEQGTYVFNRKTWKRDSKRFLPPNALQAMQVDFDEDVNVLDEDIEPSSESSSDTTTVAPVDQAEGGVDEEGVDPNAGASAAQVGFDEDADAITAQLLKPDLRCLTVSIVGIKGIGKKSLARLIFHSRAIVHHFPHRIWMSYEDMIGFMNQYYDSYIRQYTSLNIQKNRAAEEEITGANVPCGNNIMAQMVDSLFGSNKSLIVLDGSNASSFWQRIKREVRDKSNGSRIILTLNHLSEAPTVTETDFTYRLHLRSEEESWDLFTDVVKVNIPTELEVNLKKVILRKCGGLPKLIIKLGQLLSRTVATPDEWLRLLNGMNQDEDPWLEIITEINKTLPLHLRRCLFYFGLFPADYKVPARILVALWTAEGLGRQPDDENSFELTAEACLRELINCNMVQVTKKKLGGKVKTCCLPEALRVHWFSKAQKATFLHNHLESSNTTSSLSFPAARRLADHLNPNDAIFDHIHGNSTSIFPCYKNAVSFLSFDTREGSRAGEDMENFLDRCISSGSFLFLWVLDLENVYRPKLPKLVGKLTRLKYLGLRSTYLEILPIFIDKLLNLQTLDLKRTCISNLPSSIWKMQKLRHLFLDDNFRSMFVPQHEDDITLQDLQTLRGVLIDENSPVRDGMDTLLSIRKLGVKSKISVPSQKDAMTSQLKAVANWVMNLKCLQSLRLKSYDETGQPWDIHLGSLLDHTDLSDVYLVGKLQNQQLLSKFPINLIELTLSGSELAEDDPMQILDKLPNLRILRLLARSFVGKKMMCSYGGFPKLEILNLWELNFLEDWIVEEGALSSLKELEMRHCVNLRSLPDGLQLVTSLREVKLSKMMELSTRLEDRIGEDWTRISHVRNVCIQN
ncbi:probable disease resistance RPP8-like protein 2 [Mercurialis annua]|uniref:probable disease resistance RPP8-like protein 2 n=1 Tax=Mercurialis annua TaxID=3986 RepID=UPI0024AF7803|nr:probable disease resistance RPP8-like protein 2 [Mercurialis annua]